MCGVSGAVDAFLLLQVFCSTQDHRSCVSSEPFVQQICICVLFIPQSQLLLPPGQMLSGLLLGCKNPFKGCEKAFKASELNRKSIDRF